MSSLNLKYKFLNLLFTLKHKRQSFWQERLWSITALPKHRCWSASNVIRKNDNLVLKEDCILLLLKMQNLNESSLNYSQLRQFFKAISGAQHENSSCTKNHSLHAVWIPLVGSLEISWSSNSRGNSDSYSRWREENAKAQKIICKVSNTKHR